MQFSHSTMRPDRRSSRSMAQASLASPITRRICASPKPTARWPDSCSALREGTPYESPNYRWFSERYPEFVYIDRIVIARPFRASRPRPRVLRGRDELRRSARAGADLRGVPRAARRHLGAVPRHLRIPGSRPADDARRRTAASRCSPRSFAAIRSCATVSLRRRRPARRPLARRTSACRNTARAKRAAGGA